MFKATNTPHDWSEDRLQQEFYMWFHNTYPMYRGLLFAVPNGGLRDPITARKMKLLGLVPGASDMIFLWMGKAHLIELKRPDGKNGQSEAQVEWQKLVVRQGFRYYLYNDLVELKELVNEIINE